MIEIKDIYKVNFMKDKFAYCGLLRNQKRFNINDDVFFSIGSHQIFKGVIIGVELPPEQNPEYKYKVRIPEQLCVCENDVYENLICDNIFYSIGEAKTSALKNLDRMRELQEKKINAYFKQFE